MLSTRVRNADLNARDKSAADHEVDASLGAHAADEGDGVREADFVGSAGHKFNLGVSRKTVTTTTARVAWCSVVQGVA